MSSRHLNPYFHWCAGWWKWVCDCVHCVEPLNIRRQRLMTLRFVALVTNGDAADSRLNSPGLMTCGSSIRLRQPYVGNCSRRKLMYLFLRRILKFHAVRFDYVRTESKRAIMMAGIACELLMWTRQYEETHL